jgi:hypothetical protein
MSNEHMVSSRPVQAFVLIPLLALALSGCGKGKTPVPGLDDFAVTLLKGRLYVTFLAETVNWDFGATFPIPGLNDAQVSIAPDLNSAGTLFQFSIGLASLLNHGQPLPLSRLPDGRPIPDIKGGMLPRWDADIEKKLKLSLFLSNDAFAFFVPLDFISKTGVTLPDVISVPIQDEKGNLIGKAYAIPSNDSGTGSGLFVLLPYLGGTTQTNS